MMTCWKRLHILDLLINPSDERIDQLFNLWNMELAKLTLTKDKKKRTWMMEKITRKEISLKLIHAGEDEIDNLYQKLETT
jgi:hypothetical protein